MPVQCHTAAIDVFNELAVPSPAPTAASASSAEQSSSSGGGSRGAGAGLSPKLQSMAGVGAASFGAMAAFYW